jgi:transposase-like protein
MSTIGASGKPQSRRYTPAEKEQAVRMVRALREGARDLAGHGPPGR